MVEDDINQMFPSNKVSYSPLLLFNASPCRSPRFPPFPAGVGRGFSVLDLSPAAPYFLRRKNCRESFAIILRAR